MRTSSVGYRHLVGEAVLFKIFYARESGKRWGRWMVRRLMEGEWKANGRRMEGKWKNEGTNTR